VKNISSYFKKGLKGAFKGLIHNNMQHRETHPETFITWFARDTVQGPESNWPKQENDAAVAPA
jgi:hypothetical protein